MNEPIALTVQETAAAIRAIQGMNIDLSGAGRVIARAVDAINEARIGDPPGSVRVKGNEVAVRLPAKPSPHDRDDVHWWRIVHFIANTVSYAGQVVVQDWELVHEGVNDH